MGPKWLLQGSFNQNIIKKQVLLEALQVQFKYRTYPIVQSSSSKVSMHTG